MSTQLKSKRQKSDSNDGDIIYKTVFETDQSKGVDAESLEKELSAAITGEVRFDDGSKALYSTDGSNYRQVPIGVVLPKTEEDVL